MRRMLDSLSEAFPAAFKGEFEMPDPATKVPVKTEENAVMPWRPFQSLRHEIERLFDDFDKGAWTSPFRRSMFDLEPIWRRELSWTSSPAVDISESDRAYEISVELPGMDEKNIEVKITNGGLTVRGEKQEEKEEKKKDYYLHERHFGSFERHFRIPAGVDVDRIEATFKKGVLTLTLPKTPEAQKAEKKIMVKAG
jgi:HSP20 family protein